MARTRSHKDSERKWPLLIAPALTLIYQASYGQSQIPDDWERAFMTPLFKKGDKSNAADYRPVSLTSYCCKVTDHIVHRYLMKFLERNKILIDFQHGLQKRISCETQLITTIHDLALGLDRRQQVDAICWIIAWQSSSITMASETRTYPGSKVSLQTGIDNCP